MSGKGKFGGFGKEVCPDCKQTRDMHDEWDFCITKARRERTPHAAIGAGGGDEDDVKQCRAVSPSAPGGTRTCILTYHATGDHTDGPWTWTQEETRSSGSSSPDASSPSVAAGPNASEADQPTYEHGHNGRRPSETRLWEAGYRTGFAEASMSPDVPVCRCISASPCPVHEPWKFFGSSVISGASGVVGGETWHKLLVTREGDSSPPESVRLTSQVSTVYPLITKPCEICNEPVEDEDRPDFKEPWLCYYCHCNNIGGIANIKDHLNAASVLLKAWDRDRRRTAMASSECIWLRCMTVEQQVEALTFERDRLRESDRMLMQGLNVKEGERRRHRDALQAWADAYAVVRPTLVAGRLAREEALWDACMHIGLRVPLVPRESCEHVWRTIESDDQAKEQLDKCRKCGAEETHPIAPSPRPSEASKTRGFYTNEQDGKDALDVLERVSFSGEAAPCPERGRAIATTCAWYDEDYDDAASPHAMPESCTAKATHYSCCYALVHCINVCEKHRCRCKKASPCMGPATSEPATPYAGEAEEAFAVVRDIRTVIDRASAMQSRQSLLNNIMAVLDGTTIGAFGSRRHAAGPRPGEAGQPDGVDLRPTTLTLLNRALSAETELAREKRDRVTYEGLAREAQAKLEELRGTHPASVQEVNEYNRAFHERVRRETIKECIQAIQTRGVDEYGLFVTPIEAIRAIAKKLREPPSPSSGPAKEHDPMVVGPDRERVAGSESRGPTHRLTATAIVQCYFVAKNARRALRVI